MTEQHLPLSDCALELIAHRFKVLSDPTRLRLLRLLMDGELSVNELVSALQATQANVSKHLGILSDSGLIARRKVGVTALYRIADPTIFTLCNIVCQSLLTRGEQTLQRLRSDDAPLES